MSSDALLVPNAPAIEKGWSFQRRGPLVPGGIIVKNRNVVTDGPFAESKEAIGGFMIIQANSFEQAVRIAVDCPGFKFGQSVELRAIGPDFSG